MTDSLLSLSYPFLYLSFSLYMSFPLPVTLSIARSQRQPLSMLNPLVKFGAWCSLVQFGAGCDLVQGAVTCT